MIAQPTRDPEEYFPDPTDPGPGWNRVAIRWARLDGRTVVVKSGTGRHRDVIRREAAVLGALPAGVAATPVRLDEGDEVTTLVTEEVRATPDPQEAPDRILRAAAACRTLSGLHRAGWVHSRIERDHILHGPDGARLCSLGAAVPIDSNNRLARVDLAALRIVLRDELGDHVATSRAGLRMMRRSRRIVDELLRHLDDAATSTSAVLDRLADRLDELAAPRRHRMRIRRSPEVSRRRSAARRDHPRDRRRRATTAAAVVFGLAGASVMAAVHGDADDDGRPRPRHDPVGQDPRAGCAPATASAPDVDGDGCGDHLEVRGRTIRLGGTTIDVGAPGDRIRIGDWDCDGRATVLLLRPATGEVFEFRDWAAPGTPVAVGPAAVVAGARTLPEPGSDACPEPVVRTVDGTDVVVAAVRSDPGEPRP